MWAGLFIFILRYLFKSDVISEGPTDPFGGLLRRDNKQGSKRYGREKVDR